MSSEPSSRSWRERVDDALRERHGLGVACLIDPVDALVEWHRTGVEPEAAAELDAVDLVLGRWLKGLAIATRVAYQSSFRFAARTLSTGPRGVRQLLHRAIEDAERFGCELEAVAKESGGKSGTIRRRIIPWSAAVAVLVDAGIAPSPLGVRLPPKDADADLKAVSRRASFAADQMLANADTFIAARTRATLHLALRGLRMGEIEALDTRDLGLNATAVRVGRHDLALGAAAQNAVRGWLEHRRMTPGPLFVILHRHTERPTTRRLGRRSIERGLEALGEKVGEVFTAEALRRCPIVEAPSRREAVRVARAEDVYRWRGSELVEPKTSE